ncbi:MAG: NAD(P)/FAD-dependent oxidoreductase [Alicyclobacillus sp.]|nr:NAD(P)/FAD-dependent oxidoreductase [Alicyclobacillus sp.]
MPGLPVYDVIVIGGGVVGNSVLYHLSRFSRWVALLEREPDVCEGTSKANSAIVHTGFDAKPGTLEARLLAEARAMWPVVVERLKVPFLPCGAMMVAVTDAEWETIQSEVLPRARENGVTDVQLVSREDVLAAIPDVSPEVKGGLFIPGESLVDPFWLTRAYAEAAVQNGARVHLNAEVAAIRYDDAAEVFHVTARDGREFTARSVVNAAGLWSDEVARLIGDDSFTLTPRKGQFLLVEEELNLPHILLPVPNRVSKGILVTPIVFGGYLLGPTAEDIADKWDRSTTPEGLCAVLEGTQKLLPKTGSARSIRQFAGNRAVCSTGDFLIRPSHVNPRFYHVAGIRSTGISASPAIGAYVANELADRYGWKARDDWRPELPERYLDGAPCEEIVCLCRSVTKGEIDNALASPLPPATLDGVKRRTGACLGDCQGNLCMPKIMRILADSHRMPYTEVQKHLAGSRLAFAAEGGERA